MVNHRKCLVCNYGANKCSCEATCKNCLTKGNPQDECDCCQYCKKDSQECQGEACRVQVQGAQAVQGNNVTNQFITQNIHNMKPPDIGVLKDKSNLLYYLHAQEQWARLSGTPKKQQADIIMWHANSTHPELYREMVKKFGRTLVDKPDGLQKLTVFLKERFGLSFTADLMTTFKKFLAVQRKKGQDLVNFIIEFEAAYGELEKMGQTFTYNFQPLFLLERAQLSATDYQIITTNLTFNKEGEDDNEKIYESTKEAMRKHQHSNFAAQLGAKPANPNKAINTLLAYLAA